MEFLKSGWMEGYYIVLKINSCICFQMIICREDEEFLLSDEDDKTKVFKKKEPNNKVDKKYLWPHGVTPPLKNVRKRRFRKTLRKKYVEAPEIEKEVLFQIFCFYKLTYSF